MTSRHLDKAGLAIAAALLVLSGLVFWDMSRLQLNAVYGVGPKAMLIVVASGLAVLGVGNAVLAFRGDMPARESIDFRALLFILGGLAALIGIIGFGGGFIP